MTPLATSLGPGQFDINTDQLGTTMLRYVRANTVEGGVRTMLVTCVVLNLPHYLSLTTDSERHATACPGCWPCEDCGERSCLCPDHADADDDDDLSPLGQHTRKGKP